MPAASAIASNVVPSYPLAMKSFNPVSAMRWSVSRRFCSPRPSFAGEALFALGLGLVLPNAMAGAIGPYPTMAGTASAVLGFVQMTGSALYAMAVGHLDDGTLRPMTTARLPSSGMP